jgi:hypothetical protein
VKKIYPKVLPLFTNNIFEYSLSVKGLNKKKAESEENLSKGTNFRETNPYG